MRPGRHAGAVLVGSQAHPTASGGADATLRARVRLFVGVTHVTPEQVGIELRCRYVCVPKELLDHAQVGATVEEVGGKGVAQGVRMDLFTESSGNRCRANGRPCFFAAYSSTASCEQ